uniref:C2H2-type domain-containing protein n=1 Tax=Spongospora subterranea TaxID=70186 RepID=A0A0H5RLQ2_9EUKA|eukprot:CRZ09659.1 hypothetical protein [Spongospora subterranea]
MQSARLQSGLDESGIVLIPTASRVPADSQTKHLITLTDVAFRAKWPTEGGNGAWKAIEGADSSSRPTIRNPSEGHLDETGESFVGIIPGHLSKKKRVRSKRFGCGDCNKAFATRYECTRHERVHTGERPFRCSSCVRAFADKGNLKKHQLVHTRHRPHICPNCDKSFSRRTHLRMHALRVHSHLLAINPDEDGNCSASCSDDGRSGNEID